MLLVLGGLLSHLGYVLLTVSPYHWYCGPGLTAATVVVCAVAVSRRIMVRGMLALIVTGLIAYGAARLLRPWPVARDHGQNSSIVLRMGTVLPIAWSLDRVEQCYEY
ncbi:hypothetical protein [Amycolatopsis regifaucium]|uniref:Uncharacterized protein n=1 Tax=Amycolatopsis regifaucium TaxID=546365 RepID=A0A154MHB5_9PSEU|nr:hypothetical protein [Amycolatopsis regifaucium]KZB83417.1 hypothetical protein AVL48_04575 [Amycolatopsis regifaucium]OKA08882.1 hypothetical protein ATP06_0211040 [Amycolatopsis regifaucium]SFI90350.1 hypothetical protein SAMN04489731_1146 [Amycolatopsis regifaucium]